MSSEILGREAEEGRRPRQGDKMREARMRAGVPAVWPGEQPALTSCPPTAQRGGLFPAQGPDHGLCRDALVIGYKGVGPSGLHCPVGIMSKLINRNRPDFKLVII